MTMTMASENTFAWLEEHVEIYAQCPRPTRNNPCLIHDDLWASEVESLFTLLEESILPNSGELRSRAGTIACTCNSHSFDAACHQLTAKCGGNKAVSEADFRRDLYSCYHNMLNNARKLQTMDLLHRPANTINNFVKISPLVKKLFDELFINENDAVTSLLNVVRQYILKPFKGSFVVHLPFSKDHLHQFCDGNFLQDLIKQTGCEMFLDFKPSTPADTQLDFYVETACLADFKFIRESLVARADNILHPNPVEVEASKEVKPTDGSSESTTTTTGTSDTQTETPSGGSDHDKEGVTASASVSSPLDSADGTGDGTSAAPERQIESDSFIVNLEDKVNEADIQRWEEIDEMEVDLDPFEPHPEESAVVVSAELTIQLPAQVQQENSTAAQSGMDDQNQNVNVMTSNDNEESGVVNNLDGYVDNDSNQNNSNVSMDSDQNIDSSQGDHNENNGTESSDVGLARSSQPMAENMSEDISDTVGVINEESDIKHSSDINFEAEMTNEGLIVLEESSTENESKNTEDTSTVEVQHDINENHIHGAELALSAEADVIHVRHVNTQEEVEDSGISIGSDTDSNLDANPPGIPPKMQERYMIRDDVDISHLEDEIVQMKIKIYHQMLTTDAH